MTNYYEILNVPRDASNVEIKQSFRKLSLKYHPDKDNSPSSKRSYEDIMEAYATLEDAAKRNIYDKNMDVNSQKYNNTQDQALISIQTNEHVMRTHILSTRVSISLEEAFCGCQYPVEIERMIYEDNCRVREKEKIYINIEPGIDNGEIIYIKNKGHESINGIIGDVKVYVNVRDHDIYKRNGLDIYINESLTFEDSIGGFVFYIQMLNGKSLCIKNSIGDVILNGSKKILRGKGMMRNNINGNLIIEFTVIQPKRLTESIASTIKSLIIKNSQ